MDRRFLGVLAFAFVVASGASLFLYRMMNTRMTAKAAPASPRLLAAARRLDVGTVIRDLDLKQVDWGGAVPAGALVKREDIIGRGVISTIFENELILDSRVAPKGAGGGLAAMIPEGMRAVAVRVNEVVGVAGFVVPGMRVDVLISGNLPGMNAQGSMTRTLLQNIEVLSAGQDFKKDNEGKPVTVQVVNLLVNPEQAEKLSLAINQTTIQLVLRNPLDTKTAKTSGAALAELFGRPAAPNALAPHPRVAVRRKSPETSAAAARPATFVMEVINGTKRTEMSFSAAEAK
ncbi:MAG TPA: Flp pilus assembly protein CpaB [Bryobacteraceae bacterium]|nr:Flp pilus assembly protein CpaB [Bryobacteraceae bacterium]